MERVKHVMFQPLVWMAVNIICVVINFNYFVFGNSYGVQWINLPVSVIYMIYMIVLAYKSDWKYINVISCIYIVLGIIGYFVSKREFSADWLIIPSIVFFTPYAGIRYLLKSYPSWWIMCSGFGVLLLVVAYIKHRNNNKY